VRSSLEVSLQLPSWSNRHKMPPLLMSMEVVVAKLSGLKLGIAALALYILGGVGAFGGIAMIFFLKEQDVFGWGQAKSIGYLFLCVGVCLSIIGVLLMRIFRNRGLA
jgi:hypothetical protein